jgi:hypothetical protein
MGMICSMHDNKECLKMLIERPQGTRSLQRSWHRWNNVRLKVEETEYEDVGSIHLVQDRVHWCVLVNIIVNLQVP